jgi:hypothetical protein
VRASRQSSSPEKSGGDEQDGQESESAQALHPPALRDRKTERIASMTAARTTNDIMMVAIIAYAPRILYMTGFSVGLSDIYVTTLLVPVSLYSLTFAVNRSPPGSFCLIFAAHPATYLRRARPSPSSFQVTYADAVQDASQSSGNTVRSVPQKVRFRTYTPIQ